MILSTISDIIHRGDKMNNRQDVIEHIREFNRFYTVCMGILNKHFLNTDYSTTETRILFELISHKECTAKYLTKKLHIDKGYVSRIMKSFERKNLICKSVDPYDHREYLIQLTSKGQQETLMLIQQTNHQIEDLISHLNTKECDEICQAMDLITNYLSKKGV